MRAIVLDGDRVAVRADHPEPVRRDGEVMVRVLCAGICETDLQLIRGYMGFHGVLGHEFVGVARDAARSPAAGSSARSTAAATAATPALRAGPRTAPIDRCSASSTTMARSRISSPCRSATCTRFRTRMPTDVAVFTEPVAAAFQIPSQLSIARQDRVVVLGDGRLGNLCAQVLAGLSDHVLVVGKHAEQARAPAGARHRDLLCSPIGRTTDPPTSSSTARARRPALPTALNMVRPRGTIVLKTTVAGDQTMAWAPVVIDEVTIVGSRCGPFDRALSALETGEVERAAADVGTFRSGQRRRGARPRGEAGDVEGVVGR